MKVVLTALSAMYIHKSLAPWCLKAYCDERVAGCGIEVQEHSVNNDIGRVVSRIFQSRPDVAGFSCYVWNIEAVAKAASALKKVLPECVVVLGGPEVSFEPDCRAYPFADYIVQGAGEEAFAGLLAGLQNGAPKEPGVIKPCARGAFKDFPSPYTQEFYQSFEKDGVSSIANQLVYYESSRGCPFSCSYCMSGADSGVEELPLERVFREIDGLAGHGAKCVKFTDRTFNANRRRAGEILRHIQAMDTGCTFHFEAAADLFDRNLLQIISAMPDGRVQFETGIQSINARTLAETARVTDTRLSLRNIRTLAGFGNCHVHVDLIAGLPYETMETFGAAVDECVKARPHMLQLGFLKLLKGTEIRRNSAEYGYIFSDFPPYEVFANNTMSFSDIVRLKSIAAAVEKFYNSGMFVNSVNYAIHDIFGSPYKFFSELADFCEDDDPKSSLKRSYTILLNFLYKYTEKAAAEHYIKLDCLSCDPKGLLPDCIRPLREREAETEYKKGAKSANVRGEYFEYDGKTRLFIYDERDRVGKSYKVMEKGEIRGDIQES
ncbi:MAG: B12-binding domain-containing radical SAM protein [Defluviitaleaceae bacterium]|nr:B12-binding domain-containing radical SAM protein [Defluviitaleaceae bacterium]